MNRVNEDAAIAFIGGFLTGALLVAGIVKKIVRCLR